jgi:hypothetical protein
VRILAGKIAHDFRVAIRFHQDCERRRHPGLTRLGRSCRLLRNSSAASADKVVRRLAACRFKSSKMGSGISNVVFIRIAI